MARRPLAFVTRKITHTAAAIAEGRAHELVLGNLDARRDWGWAPEYVDALVRAARHESGDDYVIATGQSRSVRDFVAAAFASAGIADGERYVRSDDALHRPGVPPSWSATPPAPGESSIGNPAQALRSSLPAWSRRTARRPPSPSSQHRAAPRGTRRGRPACGWSPSSVTRRARRPRSTRRQRLSRATPRRCGPDQALRLTVTARYRPHMASTVHERSRHVYDSNERRSPLLNEVLSLYAFRDLLRLLIVRDLTLRYKRSLLGIWWTLLNPLLLTGVMYVVFSNIFRFPTGDIPFIVYLLSGVLLATFFSQGLNNVGVSVVSSANILTKVFVPPEVFAVSAAVAAAVNFLVSLLPLLVIQLITGQGIPWTVLLVPVPVLALLCLVIGVGLLVAAAAVRFPDTLDLMAIFVVLITYLTPTFYPISIVPDRFRLFIEANPLYSYLQVFRQLVYGGEAAPLWSWAVMVLTGVAALLIGTLVFSRRWRSLAAML